MAQTGIETSEILESLADRIKPDVVIVIDALAARSYSRLNKTIQISDTGIALVQVLETIGMRLHSIRLVFQFLQLVFQR